MKWISTFALALTLSHSVFAWGPQGHMIVAQIAEEQLSPAAKSAVKKYLGDQTLADVANWADFVKNQPEYQNTKGWHFLDIPDGMTYDNIPHAQEGDVVTAITAQVNVLKDPKASAANKQVALKFLVHFVGDMHQPLHVGRPSDKGGNTIRVRFEGRDTNLHALWDSGMITKQNMDYLQYAHYLQTTSLLTASYDIPNFPFSQVISEDMSARGKIYNFKPVSSQGSVVLDGKYMGANLEEMNSRLLLGGERLAGLLNGLFK